MIGAFVIASLALVQPAQAQQPFDDIVRAHVQQMLAKGYADTLSWDDLNHGHIFVPQGHDVCYADMEDLLSRVELVLYHTAEHNYRWGNATIPPEQKVPRSIVGFMDGTIAPAIDVVGNELLTSEIRYRAYGTVGIEDILAARPQLSHGNRIGDNTCVMIDGNERPTSFEFHITSDSAVVFGRE